MGMPGNANTGARLRSLGDLPLCRDPAVQGTRQNSHQPITLNALSAWGWRRRE